MKFMKKILPLIILLTAPLSSKPLLYEGFNAKGLDAGGREGFMTAWHRHAGEVGSIKHGLGLPGFSGENGALLLEKKGEALAQVAVDVTGTYYGSFRLRTAKLSKDSILGLVFAGPLFRLPAVYLDFSKDRKTEFAREGMALRPWRGFVRREVVKS